MLVGTQMIAKGHDFPRVTLVGVVSADVGLGLADFRAGERTFQLLTQVAGRAGRGERAGEAIVQTLYPAHYSVRLACRQDYRRSSSARSSTGRGCAIRRSSRSSTPWCAAARSTRRCGWRRISASALAGHAQAGGFAVLGPAPAPLTRLRGEHRVQIFLKGGRREKMRQAMRAALAALPEVRRRVVVDVDPLSVLVTGGRRSGVCGRSRYCPAPRSSVDIGAGVKQRTNITTAKRGEPQPAGVERHVLVVGARVVRAEGEQHAQQSAPSTRSTTTTRTTEPIRQRSVA